MISPEEFIRLWGRSELAPLRAAHLEGVDVPDSAKAFLAQAGLPIDVEGLALCFLPDPRGLPTLAQLLGETEPRPPEAHRYRRLGRNDVGVHFCLDEGRRGAVVAVAPLDNCPVVFVNSGVVELAECLLTYRRLWREGWKGEGKDEDAAYAARLRQAIVAVDAAAVETDPSWWSMVVLGAGHGLL